MFVITNNDNYTFICVSIDTDDFTLLLLLYKVITLYSLC